MTFTTTQVLAIVTVALVLWWLFEAPHKAVSGDVELGTPTVKASDPDTQGENDYYTSSTPGDFS